MSSLWEWKNWCVHLLTQVRCGCVKLKINCEFRFCVWSLKEITQLRCMQPWLVSLETNEWIMMCVHVWSLRQMSELRCVWSLRQMSELWCVCMREAWDKWVNWGVCEAWDKWVNYGGRGVCEAWNMLVNWGVWSLRQMSELRCVWGGGGWTLRCILNWGVYVCFIDHFYIVLFSTLEHTRYACIWFCVSD